MLHRLQLSLRFFPLVAIVHTAPYVDICEITFVGGLSPKFHVTSVSPPFLSNQSFAIYMNIDTMGIVGHGLSTDAHAWMTPVPRQRDCCPHHGRLPTRSVRSNLSRGGR